MDHGLVCEWSTCQIRSGKRLSYVDADHYLVEFGNEALKMQQAAKHA